jgi:protein-disulfide isomerase
MAASRRKHAVESGLLIVSVVCAVAMTGLVLRREFFPPPPEGHAQALKSIPISPDLWHRISQGGRRVGPVDAEVVLVLFTDFQCPSCKRFEEGTVRALLSQGHDDLAVVYRHWPLEYHEVAAEYAIGAECVRVQSEYLAFRNIAYALQDSLPLLAVSHVAARAGVEDSARFAGCLRDSTALRTVNDDLGMASELRGIGTPTVVLNGLLLRGVPTLPQLEEMIGVVRNGG